MSSHPTEGSEAEFGKARPVRDKSVSKLECADEQLEAKGDKLFGISFSRWDVAANFLTVLAFLSVLVGGFWAVFEYTQRVEAGKARETMTLIEIWDTRGARQDYQLLVSEISVLLKNIEAQAANSDLSPEEKKEKVLEKIRTRLLRDEGAVDQIENLVQFFSRLALCVQADLCSDRVAEVFFKDTISSFLVYFEPFLVEQQSSRSGYGQSVMVLNESFAN